MKNYLFTFLMLITVNASFGQQTQYNVTPGDGNGLRFWNSNYYKIHMGNLPENHYGPVTDYSIKMNMSNTPGRGWTWGIDGATPVAALNTAGNMQIAGSFQANALTVKGETYVDGGWLRVKGNKGIFFENYGGGFFMQDNSWIRTYGNKNFYHNTGVMRTDGTLQVGPNGNRFIVNSAGNVGIGTVDPKTKLEVTSGNSGDAILKLEADTDNNNESDNPRIEMYQDGKLIGVHIGFNEETPTPKNIFQISTLSPDGFVREALTIDPYTGNVGMGILLPDSKLTVKGKIHAEEVKIDLSIPAPDYVFTEEYDLLSIEEVQQHIQDKGHLPNIPSAKIMEAEGVELGIMNMKLLEKIEELMLYTIAQQKEIKELQNLKTKNKELEARLTKIEALLDGE